MQEFVITDELINSVKSIAVEAGSAIMDVYHTDYDIQIKTDNSPVTEADKKANTIITNRLKFIHINLTSF